jgi:flagellar motor switch protein FliG
MALMTGEEKAGALLLSLDPRVADAVLNQLGPEAKARLVALMKRLEASPQRQEFMNQVLEETEKVLQKSVQGPVGSPVAPNPGQTSGPRQSVIDRVVADPQKTNTKAGVSPGREQKVAGPPALKLAYTSESESAGESEEEADPLAAVNEIATDRLNRALEGENSRTIGLILSVLKGESGGQIFKKLQPDVRREVAIYMATCVMPGPEIVRRTLRAVLTKEQSLPEVVAEQTNDARFKKMAELLWTLERTERTEALAALQEHDAAAANQVRELLYQFADLLRLDARSIQKVLGQMDGKVLAVALKGADDNVKQIVMDNMSKRAREGLTEEMEFLSNVQADQIQQAQKAIVGVIQQLDQAGEIVMLR